MSAHADSEAVLAFWFQELQPRQWWLKDTGLDRRIAERFSTLHEQAGQSELWFWRGSAQGRLAEIIVLDQFSRNIHRDTPAAFALDPMALALAQEAVSQGLEEAFSPMERVFLYLPFMHSESRLIHETAVELFRRNGVDDSYQFELKHKAIIDRFGRYPHRNAILGRETTPAEAEFLTQPDSSF